MKLADMGLRSDPNPCPCTAMWNCANPVLYFRSSAMQNVASRTKCLLAATEQSMKTAER